MDSQTLTSAPEDTPTATPPALNPQQQQWADRAVSLLKETWVVKDAVLADPGRDWTAEVRQVMGDPAAARELNSALKLSELNLHGTGSSAVEISVQAMQGEGEPGSTITLATCVDTSGGDLLDAQGNSVQAPIEVGPRFRQYATATVYSADLLLISDFLLPDPMEAC